MQFPTNSFALSLPDLATVGVAVSPIMALANHACEPNAVVVFPHGPLRKGGMHIVAIADIPPGQEILTSYVDVANPQRLRQAELQDRYHFQCHCKLCSRLSHNPAWVDPREALACKNPKSCDSLARLPNLEDESEQTTACFKCGYSWNVSGKDLAEEMRVGETVLSALETSNGESEWSACLSPTEKDSSLQVSSMQTCPLTFLHVSSHSARICILHPTSSFSSSEADN